MGFEERFPRWLTGVLGIVQLVFTTAIIALEIGSAHIDLVHGTIWSGFWCGIVFIVTCLMMLFITCCCCRGRCCALCLLLLNVLSGILACVIIHFDVIFINDLCKCYLGDQICCAVRGIPSLQTNYTAIFNECGSAITQGTIALRRCPIIPYDKLPLLRAQLGCAVGMLISCALYVVLFLFACFGICFRRD